MKPDDVRELSWRKNYQNLKSYVERYGRLPTATLKSDMVAVELSRWSQKQRREITAGLLPADKIELMLQIPGWQWARSFEADKHWRESAAKFLAFIQEHRRLPRYGEYSTSEEIGMRKWLYHQRTVKRSGRLIEWKSAMLSEIEREIDKIMGVS